MTTTTAVERINQLAREMAATAPKGKKAKTPKACACGCNGWTKGGNWLPGHDGIYLGRMLAIERQKLTDAAKEQATTTQTEEAAA